MTEVHVKYKTFIKHRSGYERTNILFQMCTTKVYHLSKHAYTEKIIALSDTEKTWYRKEKKITEMLMDGSQRIMVITDYNCLESDI